MARQRGRKAEARAGQWSGSEACRPKRDPTIEKNAKPASVAGGLFLLRVPARLAP